MGIDYRQSDYYRKDYALSGAISVEVPEAQCFAKFQIVLTGVTAGQNVYIDVSPTDSVWAASPQLVMDNQQTAADGTYVVSFDMDVPSRGGLRIRVPDNAGDEAHLYISMVNNVYNWSRKL